MQVEIPVTEGQPGGFIRRHFHISLDVSQSSTLRRVRDAMMAAETRLANGKVIRSEPDAFKAVLEVIAAAGS